MVCTHGPLSMCYYKQVLIHWTSWVKLKAIELCSVDFIEFRYIIRKKEKEKKINIHVPMGFL